MKKLIFSSVLVAGMAAAAYGQGTIAVSNSGNSSTSSSATTGGLFFVDTDGTAGPSPAVAMTDPPYGTFNVELLGGSSAGSLSTVALLVSGEMVNLDVGQYFDQNGTEYTVSGVAANATGFFQLRAWTGSDTTYAAALADNALALNYLGVTAVFQNPTGGGLNPAATLANMPAIVLTTVPVPEPGSFALAGIGAAMMLIRRRK